MDYYCLRQYHSYNSGAYDLGIMAQSFWNTSHGDILYESVNNGTPTSRFWKGRWELINIPLAIPYKLFTHVEYLLLMQTLIISMGIIPLFLLTRRLLEDDLSAVFLSLVYIVNPVIHNANLFAYHSVSLAIPMIVALIYLTEQRSASPLLIAMSVLIISCRADLALLVSAYSIYLFVIFRRKKLALTILILSIAWFTLSRSTDFIRELFGLPPTLRDNITTGRWDHLGGTSPIGFMKGIATNPLTVVKSIVTSENIKYFIKITGPFGFLPIFAPAVFFIASPSIFINAISTWQASHDINHHYNGPVAAIMIIATVYAIHSLSTRTGPRWLVRLVPSKRMMVILLLFASIVSAVWKSNYMNIPNWKVKPHHEQLTSRLKNLDPALSVSAHFFLLDHLTGRRELNLFPDNVGQVELVAYDLRLGFNRVMDHTIVGHPKIDPINTYLEDVLNNPTYGIETYDDGLLLIRKGADWADGVRMLTAVTETKDFTSRNTTLPGNMFLEAVRLNGLVGFQKNVLSYTMVCRTPGEDYNPVPLEFLLESGGKNYPYSGLSLVSHLSGVFQDGILRDRFADEIGITIPEDLLHADVIVISIQGNDREYHLFDTISLSGR